MWCLVSKAFGLIPRSILQQALPYRQLDLSNIYSLHTVQRCNKHIYYNHPIFHKKPPGKTSFFVAEEKSTEGQNIKTPTAAPCGLNPYPVLATGSQGHHCFHIQSVLQLLVHHLSCTRAGPPHTPLVIDALGSWQIRASLLQAQNCNLSAGHILTYDEPKETANSLGIVSELKT